MNHPFNKNIPCCQEVETADVHKAAGAEPSEGLEQVAREIEAIHAPTYKTPEQRVKVIAAYAAILARHFSGGKGAEVSTISDKVLDAIVLDIAELPDRSSPEDWPEAMLVTAEELKSIIRGNIEDAALTGSAVEPPQPKRKMRASPLDDIHDECPDCRGTCSPVDGDGEREAQKP